MDAATKHAEAGRRLLTEINRSLDRKRIVSMVVVGEETFDI